MARNKMARRRTHTEHHFTASESVRDVVIGMSDGLTVPFALAAGMSGAVSSSAIVIAAGLAEIVAGSIAMGLGGYLAARTDAEHYYRELQEEAREIEEHPGEEAEELAEIFQQYGVERARIAPLVAALRRDKPRWTQLMMRMELGLEEPHPARSTQSALTIAGSYVSGGLIPLAPYFLIPRLSSALVASMAVTLTALAIFGYVKARLTGTPAARSAFQTTLVGGIAATAAFLLARLVG